MRLTYEISMNVIPLQITYMHSVKYFKNFFLSKVVYIGLSETQECPQMSLIVLFINAWKSTVKMKRLLSAITL